jgi:hypothetical protein
MPITFSSKKQTSLGWLILGVIGLIATLPLFIYGTIFTLFFLGIPNSQIHKIRTDSSIRQSGYGISLGLALVFIPVF